MTIRRSFIQDAILGPEVKAALLALLDRFEPVNVTDATYTFSSKPYDDKIITLNRAAGVTVTLPAATGSRARYRFIVGTTVTSNSDKIQVANATDVMAGFAIQSQDAGATLQMFEAGASDDTITMNGSSTGGIRGDVVEVIDIAAGVWAVDVRLAGTGTEATPFSAAVS